MCLNLDPPDRSWVPRDVQVASQDDFGAILDASRRPWEPKNGVKYNVFIMFRVVLQKPSRMSKSPPETPKTAFKRRPGAARDAPGASRQPQEPPGAPQERPQSRPKSASERPWRPNEAHLASKSPPESFWTSFWTPRGTIFRLQGGRFSFNLKPSGEHVQSRPVCKAYASIRPASLDALVLLLHVESLLHVD